MTLIHDDPETRLVPEGCQFRYELALEDSEVRFEMLAKSDAFLRRTLGISP